MGDVAPGVDEDIVAFKKDAGADNNADDHGDGRWQAVFFCFMGIPLWRSYYLTY